MPLRILVPTFAALIALMSACRGGAETPIVASGDDGPKSGSPGNSGNAGSTGSAVGSNGDQSDGGTTCSLPKVRGTCDAAMPSYWFNAETGKCEYFSYGGCEGNANRFETPEACVAACAPDSEVDPCKAVVCDVGKECVYQSATPICAAPCVDGSACVGAPELTSKCAGSCPNCKDCRQACLP